MAYSDVALLLALTMTVVLAYPTKDDEAYYNRLHDIHDSYGKEVRNLDGIDPREEASPVFSFLTKTDQSEESGKGPNLKFNFGSSSHLDGIGGGHLVRESELEQGLPSSVVDVLLPEYAYVGTPATFGVVRKSPLTAESEKVFGKEATLNDLLHHSRSVKLGSKCVQNAHCRDGSYYDHFMKVFSKTYSPDFNYPTTYGPMNNFGVEHVLNSKRSLDSIGGGHLLKSKRVLGNYDNINLLDSDRLGFKQIDLDLLGGNILNNKKKLDAIRGGHLLIYKKQLDPVDNSFFLNTKRYVDSIGGGHLLIYNKQLDTSDGINILSATPSLGHLGGHFSESKKDLDSIGGGHLLYHRKDLDASDDIGFQSSKSHIDSVEGNPFLETKKDLDSIGGGHLLNYKKDLDTTSSSFNVLNENIDLDSLVEKRILESKKDVDYPLEDIMKKERLLPSSYTTYKKYYAGSGLPLKSSRPLCTSSRWFQNMLNNYLAKENPKSNSKTVGDGNSISLSEENSKDKSVKAKVHLPRWLHVETNPDLVNAGIEGLPGEHRQITPLEDQSEVPFRGIIDLSNVPYRLTQNDE